MINETGQGAASRICAASPSTRTTGIPWPRGGRSGAIRRWGSPSGDEAIVLVRTETGKVFALEDRYARALELEVRSRGKDDTVDARRGVVDRHDATRRAPDRGVLTDLPEREHALVQDRPRLTGATLGSNWNAPDRVKLSLPVPEPVPGSIWTRLLIATAPRPMTVTLPLTAPPWPTNSVPPASHR